MSSVPQLDGDGDAAATAAAAATATAPPGILQVRGATSNNHVMVEGRLEQF